MLRISCFAATSTTLSFVGPSYDEQCCFIAACDVAMASRVRQLRLFTCSLSRDSIRSLDTCNLALDICRVCCCALCAFTQWFGVTDMTNIQVDETP